MHDPSGWSRREFAIAALLGTGATAGCTARGQTTDEAGHEHEQNCDCLSDWLADANGYEGAVERYPPDADPTVTVGDGRGSGHSHDAFGPAAVRVVPDTTVTWEWSGHGNPANVVALDEAFDSGGPVESHGTTFSHRFEKRGTYRYVSEPKRDAGMRGAIVVESGAV